MPRYQNDPREIIARYRSRCAETGKVIEKGDRCIYYPSVKKVYHPDSRQAEEFRSFDFRFDDTDPRFTLTY